MRGLEPELSDPRGTAVRRALADDRRVELVTALQSEGELDIQQLASRVGIHPNTVRWHLGVLADAGLVDSRPAGTRGPGRPRIVYRLSSEATLAETDEHRVLAQILADALARVANAPDHAEAAGRAWGHHVVATGKPGRCDREHALAAVIDLLDVEGFAPTQEGTTILMHRCPFHDLAEAHPEVVCAAHRGLVCGALAQLDAPLLIRDLRPFVEPSLCVLELEDRRAG
jgi:predicted ArsR family transcriptional regulator